MLFGIGFTTTVYLSAPALTEEQKILHVLNRLGFGPRPGDVERVKAMGLKSYIDQQLSPETIKDEAIEKKLSVFDELTLAPRKLDRLEATARTAGKQAKKKLKQVASQTGTAPTRQSLNSSQRQSLQKAQEARQIVAQAERQVVVNKLVRAVESQKQLYEVLVDFWSNHFNIDASKVRSAKVVDEQEVIRGHAMGKFKDLLKASATSAAMMLYLDNAQSTAANATQGRRVAAKKKKGGLNENYARELMELHTLGVEGGYTQKDVTEVARCFTGWGTDGGKYSSVFEYHDNLHDRGEKIVLGTVIPAGGGMSDGEAVLSALSSHPSTMRFISSKLCRRFVSDTPPAGLVDKCVSTWQQTDGDIKAIVRTIVTSPEFYEQSAYKSKVKSPFEFVVSATRALGATCTVEADAPNDGTTFGKKTGTGRENLTTGQIALLGQPLFHYAFPTGYPEESSKWVSSGALIGRINFALRLTSGQLKDLDVPKSTGVASPSLINTWSQQLLGHAPSEATRATISKQLASAPASSARVAALLLGSPEFQRR